MAAQKDAFVKPCFELLRKKSSYPLISEGRRICQFNLLTLAPDSGYFFDFQMDVMQKINNTGAKLCEVPGSVLEEIVSD